MKTTNISGKTVRDALAVCGGLCSMNAKSSVGYAFTVNEDNTEVNCGEFIFAGEPVTADRFTGYIDFIKHTLSDLDSGETIPIH